MSAVAQAPQPLHSNVPVTPPSVSRSTASSSTLPTPPDSIQKYSDALRQAMRSRFEAAARAEQFAKLPADASHDPDYGYDENPFDTRARLLMSLSDAPNPTGSFESGHPPLSPQTPHTRKRDRGLDSSEESDDDGEDWAQNRHSIVLDSPVPSVRRGRWSLHLGPSTGSGSGSVSVAMSRSSSFSCCDTPGSEMSFEIGRTADYVSVYGRPVLRLQTSNISPSPTSTSSLAKLAVSPFAGKTSPLATKSTSPLVTVPPVSANDRRSSLLGARSTTPLKPLTQLTPSPQPQAQARRSRKRRSLCPDAAAVAASFEPTSEEILLTRTPSETMMLTMAGLASQRGRVSRAGRRG